MPGTRKTSVWLIVGIGAAILVSCGALGAGLLLAGAIAFSNTEERDIAPARVENIARLHLPRSHNQLRSHLDGFQDRIIHARFHMHERDLPEFEKSLKCKLSALSSTPVNMTAGPKTESWWTPQSVAKGQSCESSGHPFYQAVIVDFAHAPELVVYVVTFET